MFAYLELWIKNGTKNADSEKYGNSDYSIGFDARSQFLLPNGEWGKNVAIFVFDNSSFVHADNRKKDVIS